MRTRYTDEKDGLLELSPFRQTLEIVFSLLVDATQTDIRRTHVEAIEIDLLVSNIMDSGDIALLDIESGAQGSRHGESDRHAMQASEKHD